MERMKRSAIFLLIYWHGIENVLLERGLELT